LQDIWTLCKLLIKQCTFEIRSLTPAHLILEAGLSATLCMCRVWTEGILQNFSSMPVAVLSTVLQKLR